jgi:hypothetical protein
VLLLRIDPEMFERMVPYLLLTATLLFMFSDKMKAWSQSHRQRTPSPETHQADRDGWRTIATMALLQFIIAIYGGFFGGGMGIMMLAMLAVTGMEHMHTMNALKNLLGSFITGISVLTFVVEDVLTRMQGMEGVIAWPQAIVMIVGASVGGYLGGSFSRTWDPLLVRRAVIVAGFVMTIIFFVRQ